MRVTPLVRRLGAATLVLTVGAGLTSCSDAGSTDSSTGSAADQGAGAASEEAGDDPEAEASPEAAPPELSVDDFYPSMMAAMREAETFSFETVSGSGGQSQTVSGQVRFDDTGMEMKASSTGARAMEMILLDQAMYMRSPDLGSADQWVKIDLSDPDSLFGMIGRAIDPEVTFKAMESPEELEVLGSEEVDGVATNHYRITLDPSRYLAAMGFPAAMADMLPEELVTEMWVDADDLPRQFAQTIEVPPVGGGDATSSTTPSTTRGTYSDFGADVEIEAPPADEVTENFPGA